MTNFEKIKSFSVDEMAELFTTICVVSMIGGKDLEKVLQSENVPSLEEAKELAYPSIQKADCPLMKAYEQFLSSVCVDEHTRGMVDFYLDNGTCFDCDQDPTQCMAKGYCVYER